MLLDCGHLAGKMTRQSARPRKCSLTSFSARCQVGDQPSVFGNVWQSSCIFQWLALDRSSTILLLKRVNHKKGGITKKNNPLIDGLSVVFAVICLGWIEPVQECRKETFCTEDNKGLLGFLSWEKCQEHLYEQVPQNNSMPWKLWPQLKRKRQGMLLYNKSCVGRRSGGIRSRQLWMGWQFVCLSAGPRSFLPNANDSHFNLYYVWVCVCVCVWEVTTANLNPKHWCIVMHHFSISDRLIFVPKKHDCWLDFGCVFSWSSSNV